ncbi:hypothetical protein EV361DRAFT_331760 [Lentinula raphanica]|uniref:F-box domain-containing protein n=1 Tax=Lentinula raphanica TaxID=153919 RepID=A0AA38UC69_9AGAR|nr:hypothetical protein F5880DRAFT_874595 [Lentinula raphanica]KAJ3836894.1 hypothetical protein F5878DRAFT_242070 [Lentinula raphanica]KAJ3969742.1 hypothetical protein EV361DRAFT_331760 [Lentinula raphanica]
MQVATEQPDLHLPVELWSYIFLHLDLASLRNSALTCSHFRWLARRYMYARLTIICEYSWEAFLYVFKTSQRRGLTNALERLRFVASPDIAPLIRTCSVQFQTWPDPPFEPVLNIVCDHLHLLVNLQQLEFHNILLTPSRVSDMSTLLSLKHLILKECSLQPGSISSKISTKSLTISRDSHASYDPVDPPRWLALIDPDKLLSLNLITSRATLEGLSELTSTDISLPRLQSLHLNRDRKIMHCPAFSAVLKRCPSLLHLYIREPEPEKSPEGAILLDDLPCSLHGLVLYDGPHFLLSSFYEEQLRGLRRVRLFGDRWDRTCDMIGIRDDLWHLHRGAPELESMHLRAFHTSEMCTMIANLFPMLQSLAFSLPTQTSAEDPMMALTREVRLHRSPIVNSLFLSFFPYIQPFLESLISMTLPSNLKNLVVFGMIFSDATEGGQVIEVLSGRYPSLQRIFLYFPQGFWMAWSNAETRAATESCHISDTEVIPKGITTCRQLDVPPRWF